jgi:hypothetical protein
MPSHQQITAAREKAKRIREYAVSFRREIQVQHVTTIHSAQDEKDVRLSVVKLPDVKTHREAA